jgi:DnaK suppressor protein
LRKKDIDMLRKLLIEERERLINKIILRHRDEFMQKSESFSENFATDDVDIGDIGSKVYEREFTAMLLNRESKSLKKIDNALQNIEEGTYGICKECGEKISLTRLKALLFPELCVECQKKKEKTMR